MHSWWHHKPSRWCPCVWPRNANPKLCLPRALLAFWHAAAAITLGDGLGPQTTMTRRQRSGCFLAKKHSLGAVYLARGAQRVVSWGHLVAQPVVRKPETPNGSLSPMSCAGAGSLSGTPLTSLGVPMTDLGHNSLHSQRLLKLPLWGVRFFLLIAVN